MSPFITFVAACLVGAAWAQQNTTPVPILKQINRHNEDGSYSYGYEAADGSFKIETKYPTGEVYGKYGYVDDSGKVREVEYGASKRGFEPAGSDINVPPPTLTNNAITSSNADDYDDGQYREDPSIYWKNPEYNRPVKPSANRAPQQYTTAYSAPAAQPRYNPPAQPAPVQQQYYQPAAPVQQQYYQPRPAANPQAYLNPAQYATHPSVSNIDIFGGSYSINYKK